MRLALIVGSASDADGLHRLQEHHERRAACGTGRDGSAGVARASCGAHPRPCRNRSTMSAAGFGSRGEHRMGEREREGAEHAGGFERFDCAGRRSGHEDLGQRRRVGERSLAVTFIAGPSFEHEPPHVDDPSLDESRSPRSVGPRTEPSVAIARIAASSGARSSSGVERGERSVRPCRRTPGRSCPRRCRRRLGDLPARHRLAVLAQQRHDRGDDRRPPLVGGKPGARRDARRVVVAEASAAIVLE